MFLVGNIMCNQLLVSRIVSTPLNFYLISRLQIPGICFYAASLRTSRTEGISGIELDFNQTTNNMMAELVSLASIFSAILFVFASVSPYHWEAPAGLLLSSRAISIVSISIYIFWLGFRFYSHKNLFDVDRYDGYDNGERKKPLINPREAAIIATLIIPFMYQEAESLCLALSQQPPITQNMVAAFILPFLQTQRHTKAIQFAFQDKFDESLVLTLGSTVTLSLFLGPCLVIFGWIMGNDIILSLRAIEAMAFFLSAWILTLVIWNGKSNYFDGASLIGS
jgi:calcium/proton exchanger cax